ncbi:MAG: TIGR03118 family protein [Bryobacteraceae bacterium]
MNFLRIAFLLAVVAISCAPAAEAQIAVFDFDNGSPTLFPGENIPFDQTSGGMTASFSSPNGSVFSVQSDATTFWVMKQFSGNYLYDNNLNVNPLDIKFSQQLTSITLTFATADFNQNETPTTMQLTAYLDSTSSTPVGTASAHGTYAGSTMPMGTLTFNSGGKPFNLVEITIPPAPLASSDFFVDNIQASRLVSGSTYHQTNLISDVPGGAANTDPSLIDCRGVSRSAGTTGTAWWVASAGSGNVTVYDGNGAMISTIVSVPAANGTGFGTPAGITFAGGKFYAATLDGTIARWSSTTLGGTASTVLNHSGSSASYTGIAAAARNGVTVLYVANANGGVETYNATTLKPVLLPAGAFTDSAIPGGFAPANVQTVGSKIYVTFASTGTGGYVDAFDVNGTLLLSLQTGTWMNAPYGVAQAPTNFGKYSQALLVANHGSGQIAIFSASSGKFIGLLKNSSGKPLTNAGLWGIGFGNGGMAGAPNTLYFAAGTGGVHGLFGAINGN